MFPEQLTVNIPDGWIIDNQNSDFEHNIIKLKKKNNPESYENVAKELFKNDYLFYISPRGKSEKLSKPFGELLCDPNNGVTKEQLDAIITLNKLANIAKYFNNKDYNPVKDNRFGIIFNFQRNNIEVFKYNNSRFDTGTIYFNSADNAKKAIDILGEEEIKKIFKLNY